MFFQNQMHVLLIPFINWQQSSSKQIHLSEQFNSFSVISELPGMMENVMGLDNNSDQEIKHDQWQENCIKQKLSVLIKIKIS